MVSSSPHSSFLLSKRGFTLVELLVSIAILILLVVMVTQLTNSAAIVTLGGRKHIDADTQARMIFDRMANDFSRMPRRIDLDYIFSNQTTNDTMFFYSEAPAYYDGSASDFTNRNTTALVGYRINAAYQLERFGKLLTWDGSAAAGATPGAVVYLSYPAAAPSPAATPLPLQASTLPGNWPHAIGAVTDSPPYSSGTDPDYHVIGDQVFRMAFCFLLKPYTVSGSTYPGYYSANPYNTLVSGHTNIASVQGTGLQDVEAIVVAIAILDDTSRTIVPTTTVAVNGSLVQAANLNSLVAAFPDPTAADLPTPTTTSSSPPAPTLMAQKWLDVVNSGSFAQSVGIPKAAAAQVRIYQRIFYLK